MAGGNPRPGGSLSVGKGAAPKARSVVGLAVAGAVGGAAALSWSAWIWLAFRSAP